MLAVGVQLLGAVHVLVDVDGTHDEQHDVGYEEHRDRSEEVGELGATVCRSRREEGQPRRQSARRSVRHGNACLPRVVVQRQ